MSTIIGITGGIGTGKSSVCKLIRDYGYEVMDCDKISHQILQDKKKGMGYQQVLDIFGEDILNDDGSIDRKKLGSIVFEDNDKRKQLEDIPHPLIKQRILDHSKEVEGILFVEIPLLYETDFQEIVDKVILVYTDLDNQIWRIMARDKLDFPGALKRIYMQKPMEEKMSLADYIIDNTHQEYDLGWQVKQLIQKIEGVI